MSSRTTANPSSSSSIAPPRASFSELPLEIVKYIVALVSQDRNLYEGLRRGSYEHHAYGSKASWIRDDSRLSMAISWPCWYGRELESLSQVNKRLRSLTMPYLVRRVTGVKLAQPYAIYRLSTFPYAASIQCLSLASPTKDAVPFVDIAPLFPLLTGIHSLYLNASSLIRLFRSRHPGDASSIARRNLTLEALESLGRRVKRLTVCALPPNEYFMDIIPRITSKTSLRHFGMNGTLSPLWHAETSAAGTFRKFLGECVSLESFEADDCDFDEDEDDFDFAGPISSLWHKAESLSSVRRIKMVTRAAPFVFMPAIAASFPLAERVSVVFDTTDFAALDVDQYTDEVDSVQWPRLRSFSLEGDSCIFPPVIASLSRCPELAHLHLNPNNVATPEDVFPERLPPNLRRVTFYEPAGLCRFDWQMDECRDWCSRRGIEVDWLSWRSTPSSLLPFSNYTVQGSSLAPSSQSARRDTVQDLLEWTSRRFDHLRKTNDAAGFEELKQAVQPLRERQYIERGRTFVDLVAEEW
ncbi:Proteophosphoglycan 5 [Rhodotorula toruloides ATCC 204091]|uniref:Proteophosphoglycan 5 n=1 Tax=Rhodotorula toruloides TaxID=5286 RepID=A0A0K3C8G0_RHOTO|nr:Proteophosphoglycan 5 [Rhodotorula toruloides ATCC 204091]PRQ76092.1 Proteophosphoglycan 5 [Rhodotorula toruloides]